MLTLLLLLSTLSFRAPASPPEAPAPRPEFHVVDLGTLSTSGVLDVAAAVPRYSGSQGPLAAVSVRMIVTDLHPRAAAENLGAVPVPFGAWAPTCQLAVFAVADFQDPNGIVEPAWLPAGGILISGLVAGGTPCGFELGAFDGLQDHAGASGVVSEPPCFPLPPAVIDEVLWPRPEFQGSGAWPLRVVARAIGFLETGPGSIAVQAGPSSARVQIIVGYHPARS